MQRDGLRILFFRIVTRRKGLVKTPGKEDLKIDFCSLTQSESLHPLGEGGCERSEQTDEGYLGQNAVDLRPHQSPAVTAAPLFVTYGDISPRRGENLSRPGEAFIRKVDFHEGG